MKNNFCNFPFIFVLLLQLVLFNTAWGKKSFTNNNEGFLWNTHSFTIKAVPDAPLSVSIEKIMNPCAGSNTGAINISVTGGKASYSYSWTGPDGYTKKSKNINNLAAGTYSLTVNDARENTASIQVDVNALPEILVAATIADVKCFNTLTGAVNLSVSGGSGNSYAYSWTGANGFKATTKDIGNVKAGTYNVIVTDMAGCTKSELYTIAQSTAALTFSLLKTANTSCAGNASITVNANGGTAPYSYQLQNGPYQSAAVFNTLIAGTYSITVKDSKGCEVTTSVEIPDGVIDVYEDNNLMSTAKTIPLYFPIEARIAPTAADHDWYKFTTQPANAIYSLRVYAPVIVYDFNVYDGFGNTVAGFIADARSKVYHTLSTNTTYFIKVSGPFSNTCYNVQIAPPIENLFNAGIELVTNEPQQQTAKIFPNPHNGSFTLNIPSPQDGIATIEIYNANGQIINLQKQAVVKGKNMLTTYQNMKGHLLFYKIIIGNKQITGKIIGTN